LILQTASSAAVAVETVLWQVDLNGNIMSTQGNSLITWHHNLPFRLDFRLEGGGGVVDFESSDGREDGLKMLKILVFWPCNLSNPLTQVVT
jgi:hypothetical protein